MHYKGLQGIWGTDENGLKCVDGLTGVLLLLFSHSVVSSSFATTWTVVRQAPLSRGFPRWEYWSGLPFPSPGDLAGQGSNPCLLHCRWILYPEPPGKSNRYIHMSKLLKLHTLNICSLSCLLCLSEVEKNLKEIPEVVFTNYYS